MEHSNAFLIQASIYFGAAVLAVLLARRLGLGSVAGLPARGHRDRPLGTLAVALSMLATPFLLVLHDRVLAPRLAAAGEAREHDVPEANRVIIAGLGRVGQVVARLLHASGYTPTVLDDDPDHVEQSRKFGFRAFYGDATRLDLLHAAGAGSAGFLIAALDDPEATTALARAPAGSISRDCASSRARLPRTRPASRRSGPRKATRRRDRAGCRCILALARGEGPRRQSIQG